jgi:hypothetical protein
VTDATRAAWRRLLSGRAPDRPLLVPLVHALAAQVVGWDIEPYLHDVPRMVRGSQALWRALGIDAIVSAGASCAEAEALGARLDWSTYPPAIAAPPNLDPGSPADVVTAGTRLSTAAEATSRLAATPGLDAAVVSAVTGPATLAAQASGDAASDERALERAGDIIREVALAFARAGATALFVVEDRPPPGPPHVHTVWRDALTSIAKVVRFHQAVPALVLAAAPTAHPFAGRMGAPVMCSPAPMTEGTLGSALPADPRDWELSGPAPGLITTIGEVDPSADVAEVGRRCAELRSALNRPQGATT